MFSFVFSPNTKTGICLAIKSITPIKDVLAKCHTPNSTQQQELKTDKQNINHEAIQTVSLFITPAMITVTEGVISLENTAQLLSFFHKFMHKSH